MGNSLTTISGHQLVETGLFPYARTRMWSSFALELLHCIELLQDSLLQVEEILLLRLLPLVRQALCICICSSSSQRLQLRHLCQLRPAGLSNQLVAIRLRLAFSYL